MDLQDMVGSRGLSLQWGRISWFHPSCCLCYLPVSPKPCHINDFPTLYFSCSAPQGPQPKARRLQTQREAMLWHYLHCGNNLGGTGETTLLLRPGRLGDGMEVAAEADTL